MNNSCICVPVHEPKFNWAKQFVESYNKHFDDDHIFLIFSNQKGCNIFKESNPTLKYQAIIFNGPEYNGHRLGDPTITLKKWYGVNQIYKTTNMKYVGVVDADSCFIANKNYSELFDAYYTNKILYGHFTKESIVAQIHQDSISFFNKAQYEIISNKVCKQGRVFYFWFNNIPIYERNDFAEFKTILNSNSGILTFHTFDYIVYGYYLLLKDKFEMYNFDNAHEQFSILEQSNNSSILEIIQPMWLRKKYVTTNSVILKNVFMSLHLDH